MSYMDHEKGKKVLFEVKQLMNVLNIPFFLIQGTALGAYRDKGFTPTEKDIDLGVMFEEFCHKSYSLLWSCVRNGFDVEVFQAPFTRARTIVLWKDTIHVDIVSFTRWKNKRFCASPVRQWIDPPYCLVHDAEILENATPINFFGKRFLIPLNIEEYLTREYGDWRTPREDHVSRTRIYNYIEQEGIPHDHLEYLTS